MTHYSFSRNGLYGEMSLNAPLGSVKDTYRGYIGGCIGLALRAASVPQKNRNPNEQLWLWQHPEV